MIDIWLVRHGEASAGWDVSPDPGLSALGQTQAQQAADRLLALLPGAVNIISSPLLRTQETAAPFAERLGQLVTLDAAFRELPSPVPLAERHAWLKTFMHQSWAEQQPEQWAWRERIIAALGALNTPSVIFTHFMVINAVLAHVNQRAATVQALPANGSVHHFQLSESGELSIAALGEQLSSVVL
jgi:broad specificity phosphatase PhoE